MLKFSNPFKKENRPRLFAFLKKLGIGLSIAFNFVFLLLLILGLATPTVKMASAADDGQTDFDMPEYVQSLSVDYDYQYYYYGGFNYQQGTVTYPTSGDRYQGYMINGGLLPCNKYVFPFPTSVTSGTWETYTLGTVYFSLLDGVFQPATVQPTDRYVPYIQLINYAYVYYYTNGGNPYCQVYFSSNLNASYVKNVPGYGDVLLDWTFDGTLCYAGMVQGAFVAGLGNFASNFVANNDIDGTFSFGPEEGLPSLGLLDQTSYLSLSKPLHMASDLDRFSPVSKLVTPQMNYPYWSVSVPDDLTIYCCSVPCGTFNFSYPSSLTESLVHDYYSDGYNSGYSNGYVNGDTDGYNRGYETGVASSSPITSFSGLISNGFNAVASVLNLNIFGLTLGTWILIPVVIMLILRVISLFNNGG